MDAEAIIAACEAEAQPFIDRGTTDSMAYGGVMLTECIENAVAEHLYRVMSDSVSEREIRGRLFAITHNHYKLYGQLWQLRNECVPSCGNEGAVLATTMPLIFLEPLLEDIQRLDRCSNPRR